MKDEARPTPSSFILHPSSFLIEQRVERLSRVVGRENLAFIGREIAHDFRREERALIPRMFVRHARRDVRAALPRRRRIEEAAVPARVQVLAASQARLIFSQISEILANLTALAALECFRAEAAGGASARRAFDALRPRFRPWSRWASSVST
jgi:hypothetical protein